GFDALGPKHAVAEGAADLTRYSILANDGAVVWCGDLKPQSFIAWGNNKTFYSVDFSELTRPGTYRIQIGSSASPRFEVGEDRLFSTTFAKVLGYFNAVRADDADVWAADEKAPLNGTDKRVDVRGGWYDASGDISKYLSHLSYANFLNPQQIPLVAWSLAWAYDEGGSALSELGASSKVQAEALWGADFLLRVLDPAGFFYMTVFDHWSGELGQREICAFEGEAGKSTNSWQTALREGGGMAIAALARVARWQAKGAFSAAEYLAGAERAFEHLQNNGQQYADDGKENVIDDYTGLLAASELYATTNTATYLDAARKRAASLIGRLSDEGYFIADGAARPFWHASDAGLPTIALLRYLQVESDSARKSSTQVAIRKHLDYQLSVTGAVTNPFGYARQHTSASSQGFFIPHENESKYWWQGENARLSSLAAAALLGAEALKASGSEYLDLIRFAGHQLDWVLGANPYNLCFLQGFGTENPPKYCADKTQSGTITGGIANGITGQAPDGSGIQWLSGGECWDDWRWVEQWLPHAAWYLVAITALAQQ
ncbi:MAG TPA: glycoside hydrolase family 9 protein, partial [Polyangiaceae bacterium]|nr:glycoside hydrolase family 9 protein [Polyangiaceae bacterium]